LGGISLFVIRNLRFEGVFPYFVSGNIRFFWGGGYGRCLTLKGRVSYINWNMSNSARDRRRAANRGLDVRASDCDLSCKRSLSAISTLMCKTSSERSARRLLGLEEVLLHLEYKKFADFTYLMDSYQARSGIDLGNIDSAARLRFQEILLASTGLPVMILFMAAKPQWVVLKEAQSSHLVSLFSSILSAHKPPDPDPSIRRSIDTVLRTMSTEYDRCCARAVLFLGMPDAIQTLGFNYEKMEREQVTVFGVAVTLNELESVAKTDVISSQTKRIKDLAAKIDNKRISLKVRRYKLDAATIAEEEEVKRCLCFFFSFHPLTPLFFNPYTLALILSVLLCSFLFRLVFVALNDFLNADPFAS